MSLSRSFRSPRRALSNPRAFTVSEAACLLDLSVWTLEKRIQAGKIKTYTETTYPRFPGKPHPFKRVRLYIRSAELERYMQGREQEHKQKHPGEGTKHPAGGRGGGSTLRKKGEVLRAREGEAETEAPAGGR